MIWNREEYIAHMNFEFTGREMFCELFGGLVGLDKEWRAQGASEDEINLSAFGFDSVKYVNIPALTGAITDIEPKVISENSEEQISIDNMGRTVKLCKQSATIPLPMTYPVKTFDDWEKIKHWYEFKEERIDYEKLNEVNESFKNGALTIFHMPGGFDEPRQLLGEEELCYAYYENPELIEDILKTIRGCNEKIFERIFDKIKVDYLFVHEDLAGKSGPLVGPNQIEQFIKPYYLKMWDMAKACGAKIFSQDSDGNMNSVIDSFLDCGLTHMYPCEPGAGMDICEIRKQYKNRLALKGGIDKYVLHGSKNDILKELEYKLNGVCRGGGTVFALDHRIPNGVSIENYRYYVKTAREILGLEDAVKSEHIRMAF